MTVQDECFLLLALARLNPVQQQEALGLCQGATGPLYQALIQARLLPPQLAATLLSELPTVPFDCAPCQRSFSHAQLEQAGRARCLSCGGGLTARNHSPGAAAPRGRATGSDIVASEPLLSVGAYQVVSEIGRGSFGVVYEGRREGLARRFAIKVLLAPELANEETLARFQLEAQVASKLEDEGVVGAIDFGWTGRHPYYVMPFVEGSTLRERLRGGPLPLEEALRVIRSLALTVSRAHDQSVIHRDLKPANVILDARSGVPRITDFGLCRDRTLHRTLTVSGDMLGTPSYMAPEQIRGETGLDHRADVYSLGVILFECLTGRRPFVAKTPHTLYTQVLTTPAPLPSEFAQSLPASLDAICARALAKSPADRYPTALALVRDLERVRVGGPAGGSAADSNPRSPLPGVVAGVLGLVLLLGAGGVLYRTEARSVGEVRALVAKVDEAESVPDLLAASLELEQAAQRAAGDPSLEAEVSRARVAWVHRSLKRAELSTTPGERETRLLETCARLSEGELLDLVSAAERDVKRRALLRSLEDGQLEADSESGRLLLEGLAHDRERLAPLTKRWIEGAKAKVREGIGQRSAEGVRSAEELLGVIRALMSSLEIADEAGAHLEVEVRTASALAPAWELDRKGAPLAELLDALLAAREASRDEASDRRIELETFWTNLRRGQFKGVLSAGQRLGTSQDVGHEARLAVCYMLRGLRAWRSYPEQLAALTRSDMHGKAGLTAAAFLAIQHRRERPEPRFMHGALADVKKALTIDPWFEPALAAQGALHAHLGDYTSAKQSWSAAEAICPNDSMLYFLAASVLSRGNTLTPPNPERARLRAWALDRFVEVTAGTKSQLRNHLLRSRGESLLERGPSLASEAVANYEALIEARPFGLRARFGYGVALHQLGKTEQARQQWELAHAIAPERHSWDRPPATVADLLAKLPREIASSVRPAVEEVTSPTRRVEALLAGLSRTESEALELVIRSAVRGAPRATIQQLALRVANANPESPGVALWLARLLVGRDVPGNMPLAAITGARALGADGDEIDLLEGRWHAQAGRVREALVVLNGVRERDPEGVGGLLATSWVARLQGREADAIAAAAAALAKAPGDYRAHVARARALAKSQPTEAYMTAVRARALVGDLDAETLLALHETHMWSAYHDLRVWLPEHQLEALEGLSGGIEPYLVHAEAITNIAAKLFPNEREEMKRLGAKAELVLARARRRSPQRAEIDLIQGGAMLVMARGERDIIDHWREVLQRAPWLRVPDLWRALFRDRWKESDRLERMLEEFADD